MTDACVRMRENCQERLQDICLYSWKNSIGVSHGKKHGERPGLEIRILDIYSVRYLHGFQVVLLSKS